MYENKEFLAIHDFVNNLLKVNKLFDVIRIIDPIRNLIVYYNDLSEIGVPYFCNNFLNIDEKCENCISTRALNEDETYIKIQYEVDKIYMITAAKVSINRKEYLMEMIKDITISLVADLGEKEELKNIISDLNKKLVIDELTGVYNRRYINERLPEDIYNVDLNNKKISIIMADIDGFKEINDNFGHMAGDVVLKEVSNIIKKNIRNKHDWAARFGGDEFLIVVQNTNKDIAYMICEKIRRSITNKSFFCRDKEIKVTASFGAYTLEPNIENIEEVLKNVDENLYEAKRLGKNRTVSS